MTDTSIAKVIGRRVWDSRGRPTVEAEVHLAGGVIGRAIAPAGASAGSGEAVDLRDGGPALGGLDVRRAVANVSGEIAAALRGRDAADQAGIDLMMIELDGTPNKSRLGGNALVAVSMAVAHATAAAQGVPLWRYLGAQAPRVPVPEIQIFGGGAHAGRRVDIQDFMVIAIGATGFAEALDWTAEVYRAAGTRLAAEGRLYGVADEGGFWPAFDSNEQALDYLTDAIAKAGFTPGRQVAISLDIASTQFFANRRYRLGLDKRELDADAFADLLLGWLGRYPICAIEDPAAEGEDAAMARFTARARGTALVIGDDFLVTNAARIAATARMQACTAALIKPNQAGTLTETRAAVDAARAAGWRTIVSARSGETEDVTICHLAAGWGADVLKVGSFTRSERMAKWNECLRLAEVPGAYFTRWRPIG